MGSWHSLGPRVSSIHLSTARRVAVTTSPQGSRQICSIEIVPIMITAPRLVATTPHECDGCRRSSTFTIKSTKSCAIPSRDLLFMAQILSVMYLKAMRVLFGSPTHHLPSCSTVPVVPFRIIIVEFLSESVDEEVTDKFLNSMAKSASPWRYKVSSKSRESHFLS